jgi:AcrR family transcriptional regulator
MSTRKQSGRSSARGTDDADVGWRRRLIDAAARLGARARGITALGVRELGREAGLNPNTFYRHFQTLDDLGLAVVEDFATTVRELHGASAALRARLRRILAELAEEMACDMRELELVPALLGPDGEPLARELSGVLIQQLFLGSLEYIEDPASRVDLRQRAVKLIALLAFPALPEPTLATALRAGWIGACSTSDSERFGVALRNRR